MSNNIAPIIEELRRAYTILKKEVFDKSPYLTDAWIYDPDTGKGTKNPNPTAKMPMPVITVQARGRKHVDGWYKPAAWQSEAADALNVLAGSSKGVIASTDEICIAAEALSKKPEELLVILVHQMIHHATNHKYQDPTATQTEAGYHNARFRDFCWRLGLNVEQDGSGGFRNTTLMPGSDIAKAIAKVHLDEDVFDISRKSEDEAERVLKGSKLKKWSCNCTNIRVATYIEATCNMCGQPFTYSDKDKDNERVNDWLNAQKRQADRRQEYYGRRYK